MLPRYQATRCTCTDINIQGQPQVQPHEAGAAKTSPPVSVPSLLAISSGAALFSPALKAQMLELLPTPLLKALKLLLTLLKPLLKKLLLLSNSIGFAV